MTIDKTTAEKYFGEKPLTKQQAKMVLKALRNPLARGAVMMSSGKMTKEERKALEAWLEEYIKQ